MRTFTLKGLFVTAIFMLLGCLAIHAADGDLITKQITIKLEEAGTLPSKIGDTKKYKITNLKIMGEINGTDLRFIREMAGCDYKGKGTEGKLATLDLSEAKIVKGGDYYYNYYGCYTLDDVIGNQAFDGCSSLTSLTLPSSVTEIDRSAFERCNNLKECNCLLDSDLETCLAYSHDDWTKIPVDEIKYYHNGQELTKLEIPSGVDKIGSYSFYKGVNLTSLTLPSSVTSIGSSAFEGCSGLTSVYVSWKSPLSIFASTFKDANTEKCILYVPNGTYDDYWISNWGIFENIVEYDATGINHITTSGDAKEISRYAADGQRLEVPAKGLNIVKYSDGSVKKVAVE